MNNTVFLIACLISLNCASLFAAAPNNHKSSPHAQASHGSATGVAGKAGLGHSAAPTATAQKAGHSTDAVSLQRLPLRRIPFLRLTTLGHKSGK